MAKRAIPYGPYVYSLSDSTGAVFYVGKGRGARMYQHATDAMRGKPGLKNDLIRAIIADGGKIQHLVLGEFDTDEEAVAEENRLLKTLANLTNIAGPRNCVHHCDKGRNIAALARIEKLQKKVLPFCEWVKRAHRTKQDYKFYGDIMLAIEETKKFLQNKIALA